jgi:uncharacterized protein
MKIGIIGSGIAGLAAARQLAGRCEVTLFEQSSKLGGHVYTVPVARAGATDFVDMGFIVCNRQNYPLFFAMLNELGVTTQPTSMSFSVALPDQGIEWSSRSLSGMFAQRQRLLSYQHWRFLLAVFRMLATMRNDLAAPSSTSRLAAQSLDEYLHSRTISNQVRDGFVVPLAAALWSLSPQRCGEFPALTYLQFMNQHGMLDPVHPLPWETIVGGSHTYVNALHKRLQQRGVTIELNTAITSVSRSQRSVTVGTSSRDYNFDRIIVATAADVALHMLSDADEREQRVLGAFGYSDNRTVLHRDTDFLPRSKAAHASWNYIATDATEPKVTVTYSMNHLQRLPAASPYLVTLNPHRIISPSMIFHETKFRHPQFNRAALAAQSELSELSNGTIDRLTHFAGAYARFGFHEDGMRSGVLAARRALAHHGAKPRTLANGVSATDGAA